MVSTKPGLKIIRDKYKNVPEDLPRKRAIPVPIQVSFVTWLRCFNHFANSSTCLLILVLNVLLIRGIDYYNLKYLLIFAPFQSSWAYTTWTSQEDISLQNSIFLCFDTFNNQLTTKANLSHYHHFLACFL